MNCNFFESLDKESSGSSIWEKYNPDTIASETLFQGPLKKHSKNTEDELSVRYFILKKDHLLYKKSQAAEAVSSAMYIKYARLTLPGQDETDVTPASMVKDKYPLKLCYKGKYSILYAQNQEDFDKWVDQLTKVVLRTDFHTRFTVSKIIGSGAFANVYEATNKALNKKFAVKGFNKQYLEGEEKGKLSLWNEINILRQMRHPNLLRLHEVHETKNSVYLVFDILEGGELGKYLEGKAGLPEAELVPIMHGLLRGINFMACKDFVHRDLKPNNIMMRKEDHGMPIVKETPVIVDFGLAASIHEKNHIYKRCGTPGYIAPEVIGAKNVEGNFSVTTKCDVYSLGIIMYYLCTGKNPFERADYNVDMIIRKNLESRIEFPEVLFKRYSPEVLKLLRAMLISDPEKRISAKACLTSPLFGDYISSADLQIPDEVFDSPVKQFVGTIDSLSKRGPDSGPGNEVMSNDSIAVNSKGAIQNKADGRGGVRLPSPNLYKKSLMSRMHGNESPSRHNSNERSESTGSRMSYINSAATSSLGSNSPKSGFGSPLNSPKASDQKKDKDRKKSCFAHPYTDA